MGGLSRRYVKVMEMKNEGKNPIILDAGDFFFSTTKLNKNNIESEEYRAGAILEGYNRIGCDAINIGKYELLNGLSFLKNMSNMTEIPFLSANLKDSKTKELLFEPYKIIKRGELSFGVIGITSLLPDTSTTIIADDYIQSGNNYINELSGKTDVIIMLVNTDRKSQNELAGVFNNADFIITSGSTNLTRTNATQKDGGPYMFSCGKQGKYLMVIDAEMKDEKLPFINISNHEKKINNVKKRFERLQKKDPNKTLEDIYKDQANILKLIDQYKADLKVSEDAISQAKNTVVYQTIGLNRKISDDPEILSFVNKSLSTCKTLKPAVKDLKDSKIDHSGHNH